MSTALRFAALGPLLCVRADDPDVCVELGPQRQQAVLAALLLRHGHAVPATELLRDVWDDDPPRTGVRVVTSYVHRLRRLLDPDGGGTGSGSAEVIVRERAGYVLHVADNASDVDVFAAGHAAGVAAAASGDHAGAARMLNDALGLWRGVALAGLPGGGAERERRRLAELRRATRTAYFSAVLACGHPLDVIPGLTEAVADDPLDERTATLLMTALHRCGRDRDALAIFDQARRTLAAELGLEPGAELQAAQRVVLSGDVQQPAAEPPAEPSVTQDRADPGDAAGGDVQRDTKPPRPRHELPPDVPVLAGRDEELARLLAPAECDRVADVRSVDGMPGIGKTALALRAAHRLAPHYPDGQLFVDLAGHLPDREPMAVGQVLDRVLRAVGVAASALPDSVAERSALWRDIAGSRRILVLLDDAVSSDQVRPLLVPGGGCLMLVTSRRRLAGLDAVRALTLASLSDDSAAELIRVIARPDTEPSGQPGELHELASLCSGLPLAVRVVAARLERRPSWTAGHLVRMLRAGGLDEFETEGRSLRTALALSCDALDGAQRSALTALALLPGRDADAYAVAAVGVDRSSTTVAASDVESSLGSLVDANLADEAAPGRFRLHDLVRTYALETAERGATGPERTAALLDYYLHMSHRAAGHLASTGAPVDCGPHRAPAEVPPERGETGAVEWFERELPGIVAAVTTYAAVHPDAAWRLAACVASWVVPQLLLAECEVVGRAGLAAARAVGSDHGRSILLRLLAFRAMTDGQHDVARDLCEEALAAHEALGDVANQLKTLVSLTSLATVAGDYAATERHLEGARRLAAEHDCHDLDQFVDYHHGDYLALVDRPDEARPWLEAAMASAQAAGDTYMRIHAAVTLGGVLVRVGATQDARDLVAVTREHAAGRLDAHSTASMLHVEASATLAEGDLAGALELFADAAAIARQHGVHDVEIDVALGWGRALLDANRVHEAQLHLNRALQLTVRCNQPRERAHALAALGQCACAVGDRNGARTHWQEAERRYSALGHTDRADRTRRLRLEITPGSAPTDQVSTAPLG